MILCWVTAFAIFLAFASSTRRPISQPSVFISRSDVALVTGPGSIMDDVAGPLVSATLRHIENFFGPAPDDTGAENVAEGTRYYFHDSNGKQYLDETGRVFSALKDAIAHARILAAELAQDRDWDGFVISMTDADGRVVAQIPVRA